VNESCETKSLMVSLVSGLEHSPNVSDARLLMKSRGYIISKIADITVTSKTNKELWAHIDELRGRRRQWE